MTLFKWSRTASSNATADGSINWAEGQAPSSINDSARATMAAVAKYRDDISGAIATGGTSTAYTVTSYQGFDPLPHMDGAMIAFTPHTTNGATVTLNVDSLGAKPLRSAPSTELLAGTLIQGTPYVATYNNSDAVWYLRGFYGNAYNLPLGGVLGYFGTTAPNSSFVFPYGQAISRTTYATLFSLFSTTFGSGDGSTTFNVPDLRGRTIAGLDNMGGSAASRITTVGSGTTLGAAGGGESSTLITSNLPPYTPVGSVASSGTVNLPYNGGVGYNAGGGVVAYIRPSSGGNQNDAAALSITSTFTGTAQGGTSTAFNNLPPTMLCNYILRII